MTVYKVSSHIDFYKADSVRKRSVIVYVHYIRALNYLLYHSDDQSGICANKSIPSLIFARRVPSKITRNIIWWRLVTRFISFIKVGSERLTYTWRNIQYLDRFLNIFYINLLLSWMSTAQGGYSVSLLFRVDSKWSLRLLIEDFPSIS